MGKLNSLVSSISALNSASSLINAFVTEREINELKKTNPIDGEVLRILEIVFRKSRFPAPFKLSKLPIWVATKRQPSVFTTEDNIRATAVVDLDLHLIQIDFVPNVEIIEQDSVKIVLGLLNEALPTTKIKIIGQSKKGFFSGRETLDISFSRTLVYKNMRQPSVQILLNLMRGSIEYANSLSKVAPYFAQMMEPEKIFSSLLPLITKETKPNPKVSYQQLMEYLRTFIKEHNYSIAENANNGIIYFRGGTKEDLLRFAKITNDSQIIFGCFLEQLQADKSVYDRAKVYSFINYVNSEYTYFGKLALNRSTNILEYITAVDLIGAEDEISSQLLSNMVEENEAFSNSLLGKIKQVDEGLISLSEACKQLI